MAKIIVDIACSEKGCGCCELMDPVRNYCIAFQEPLDVEKGELQRCCDCIDAQFE